LKNKGKVTNWQRAQFMEPPTGAGAGAEKGKIGRVVLEDGWDDGRRRDAGDACLIKT